MELAESQEARGLYVLVENEVAEEEEEAELAGAVGKQTAWVSEDSSRTDHNLLDHTLKMV